MAQGDIYKLVQYFLIGGVEAIIRRWYEQLDAPGTSWDLAVEWDNVLNPVIRSLVSDQMSLLRVEVQNLSDPADFTAVNQGGVLGQQTSEFLATFVAFGFEFPSGDKRIRSGTCRLPGVTEDTVIDGQLNPIYQGNVDALADSLSENLVATVGRFGPVLYTPGNEKTFDLPLAVSITDGFYTRITTQNTRKS